MTFVLSGFITFNVAEVWPCGCVFRSCLQMRREVGFEDV